MVRDPQSAEKSPAFEAQFGWGLIRRVYGADMLHTLANDVLGWPS